jgi:uncharacterized protein
MSKQHFFLKLNPPRPSFMMDMTDEEKQIMHSHVGYWNQLLEDGIAIVFGPVMHPNGGHGVGVVAVDSEEQLKEVIAKDPANGLNVYEFFPMRAVYKEN